MKKYRSYVDYLSTYGWELLGTFDNEDTVMILDRLFNDNHEKKMMSIECDWGIDGYSEFPVFLYNGSKDDDKYIEFRNNLIMRNDVKALVKNKGFDK